MFSGLWTKRAGCAALAVCLGIAGCASTPSPAPVIQRLPDSTRTSSMVAPRPGFYTVKKGDTLYSIALDYGLDYRELAAWNKIDNAGVIRIGQQLRLTPPPAAATALPATPPATTVVTAPLKSPPPVQGKPMGASEAAAAPPAPGVQPAASAAMLETEPLALKLPYSDQALAQLQAAPPVPAQTATAAPQAQPESNGGSSEDAAHLDWGWPATGKIVSEFSESGNMKGIDITGKMGQPVFASAAGKVVYSGSGLRGYGKLIIIKHNKTYLSAYAHNSEILVKEGQTVAKGQKIAEMGDTDASRVELHFEIRRLGKPVDPLKYLPANQS